MGSKSYGSVESTAVTINSLTNAAVQPPLLQKVCTDEQPPLTYYHKQLLKIKKDNFFKEHVYDQIIQARKFIDQQYAQPVSLSDMADKAFLSKYHFARLFRNTYGRTPHQYLTAVRIAQAKRLLKTNGPVQAVCFAVGFDSVSSFTGLFKRITGSTPSTYQAKQKSNFEEVI